MTMSQSGWGFFHPFDGPRQVQRRPADEAAGPLSTPTLREDDVNQPAFEAGGADAASRRLSDTLLRGLPPAEVARVGGLFAVQSFARGEALLLAGQQSRFLGVLLEGAASVQARKDSAALTLEELGPGDVFGEGGFFDPDTARTADVVARSACKVALLPWPIYLRLVQAEDRAVAVMERNLIGLVAERMRSTDGRLAGLLEAADAGTWLDALKRLFGGGGR